MLAEKILYRYTLNENFKEEQGKQASLCGHVLTRGIHNDYIKLMNELEPFVRTKSNPQGILDYVRVKQQTGEVLDDTRSDYETIPTMYTRDGLGTLKRPELIELCKQHGIDYVNKQEKWIVNAIVESQEKMKKDLKLKHNFVLIDGQDILNENDEDQESDNVIVVFE